MLYADCVPNIKTDFKRDVFTYKVPASLLLDIKVGSVVLVPFRNKKTQALVLKLKRQIRSKVRGEIKPIIKVLFKDRALTSIQEKLAYFLKNYYHAPLGEIIFLMLPKIKIRIK